MRTWALALVLFVLLVWAAPSASAPSSVEWLVTADRLFDGDRMVEPGAVAIAGGRVVAVGSAARSLNARRVRAFRGATILPGLVDLHVHGLGCGQVASAVTSVRDLAAPLLALPVPPVRRAPRVVAAGPFVTPPGGYPAPVHGASLAHVVRGTDEARAAVQMLVQRGAGVIKVGVTESLPNLSLDELRAIVTEAHARGVRVTAHVEDSSGTTRALDAGVDDLAHIPSRPDAELMARVAREGVELVGTLHVVSSFARAGVLANARAFVRAGGTLLYGSDYGNPGIPLGVDPAELGLMNRAGLSKLDVLRNATSRSGAVLGVKNVGRLRPGAPADIVVVEGNPLRDLARVASVPTLLLVRGHVVIDRDRLIRPAARPYC